MYNVALYSQSQRSELFRESAASKGITVSIVEKDFWVTWTLGKIFSDTWLGKILMFKGGTSLSKVFGVIERFSEDIDLILDWQTLTQEDLLRDRSKTKQQQLNQDVNENAKIYIREKLLPYLNELLSPLCNCQIKEDAFSIHVMYPATFNDSYLRPEILLEIGPLASWSPYQSYEISPLAAEIFPQLFKQLTCKVNVIVAKRTFWEKATILHHEANRPNTSPMPSRYSRHYYDLAMMAQSLIKEDAMDDRALLYDVVVFKKRFYSRGWADYDAVLNGACKLLPPQDRYQALKKDYEAMASMIFGDYPPFDTIMTILKTLEYEINQKAAFE